MKIYDKTGIELLDINVADSSYRFSEIMSSRELTLYFSLNEFIDVPVDSYADHQGDRFYLFDKSNFKKNSGKDFEFTLILHSITEKPTRFKFYDYANGGYIFSLTAKPIVHLQMIVNVLNAKDTGWTVGEVIDSSEIVLNYSHNNCLEAIAMVCDEVKTEFEITPAKVIHLRKTEYNKETPLALAYGQGNGLKPGIERKNGEKGRPVERLMVQGGTRNIDFSAYGSKYLLLPLSQTLIYNGRTYVTDAEGLYIQRGDKAIETGQEDSLDASTIYPSRVCVVTGVVVVDAAKNLYNVVDSTIPEALNFEENLIAGQTMTVVFQTGMLAGKEFEVKYAHEGRVFELVPKDIDTITMPGGVYLPELTDTFVIFGSSLPDAYICDNVTKTGASWDMFREAVAYFYEHEEDKFSYGGPLSPIWLKENWAVASGKIKLGGYCSLTDPELGGVLIRIRSIKDMVNNPYDITVDLSNALVKPSFSTVLAKLNAYTASLAVQQLTEIRNALATSGGDITAITQYLSNIYNISFQDIMNYLNSTTTNIIGDSTSKLISGTVVWKSGMTYSSTNFKYKIVGVPYEAIATALTLNDSDAVNDRIDVFYLDTFGNINVKTGTPSANPVQPTLTETELFVTSAYVAANSLTPSGIITEKIYDEHAIDEWTPTASADLGKTTVSVDAINGPYAGLKHIKASIAVPVETIIYPAHHIGEEYQGGVIFWIDPASAGKKGLIAAKTDTVTDVFWSRLSGYATYTTGGTGTLIGTGQANSAAMLATPAAAAQAIKYVDELIIDTFTDWFIGSEKEMQLLHDRRYNVGNFNPSKDYWSSTEFEWDRAVMIDWETGTAYARDKNNRFNVRAIREFDDSTLPDSSTVTSYTPEDTNIIFSAPAEKNAIDGILSFQMKTSKVWNDNTLLIIETYSGAIRTGKCTVGVLTNLFGFNPAQSESYQLVAISYNNFSLSQTKFDALKISLSGSWPNNMELLIDSIRYQSTAMLQKREAGTVLQIQEQVLSVENWIPVAAIYLYTYENFKITDSSIVDVIPINEDMDVVQAAVLFPETNSSNGKVELYAKNIPTADIRVTINITEAAL